jgi:uncharacterized protein (TIGR00290 family)
MGQPTAWMSWSSGKDSALALQATRLAGDVEVVGLLTTVNSSVDRVAMHAVRRTLLEAQAKALNLPLHVVELPWPCPNAVYEDRMAAACAAAQAAGVGSMVFGDLFLEDIRAYREQSLREYAITPLFPLWERPTDLVARDILAAGIRAVLTCVDPTQVPASLAGRWYDQSLLTDLPTEADPCGENGEFHTLVVDGPGFGRALDVSVGEIVERDGFVFADVVPGPAGAAVPRV